MTDQEYVAKAKAELDDFQATWEKGMKEKPDQYPAEIEEGDWGDQELAHRFSGYIG